MKWLLVPFLKLTQCEDWPQAKRSIVNSLRTMPWVLIILLGFKGLAFHLSVRCDSVDRYVSFGYLAQENYDSSLHLGR